MPLQNVLGATSYEEPSKQALIFILDEKYVKETPCKVDLEVALVHELMYLKTSLLTDMDETSLQAQAMHILVDDMAKALVKAKNMQ